jgi:hypothetical protein
MKQIYVISLGVIALGLCNANIESLEKSAYQVGSCFMGSMLADNQEITTEPQADEGSNANSPAGKAIKGKNPQPDGSSGQDGESTEEDVDSEED